MIFQSRQPISSTCFNFFDFPKLGKFRDVTVDAAEGHHDGAGGGRSGRGAVARVLDEEEVAEDDRLSDRDVAVAAGGQRSRPEYHLRWTLPHGVRQLSWESHG